jgi:uncharacterized protein (DUF934 family)
MPLIKNGAFVEDRFVFIPEGQAFPDDGGVMVSLARFQSERDSIIAHHRPVCVRLAAAENPEVLKDDLANIDAIALEFPIFRDGRAFSWARMLRERFAYQGEIRAVGHFLYDQLAFLMRVGFDAFEVRQDFRIAEFSRAMDEMTYVYQPSVDRRKTVMQIRRGE